jgi:hypothetical protein
MKTMHWILIFCLIGGSPPLKPLQKKPIQSVVSKLRGSRVEICELGRQIASSEAKEIPVKTENPYNQQLNQWSMPNHQEITLSWGNQEYVLFYCSKGEFMIDSFVQVQNRDEIKANISDDSVKACIGRPTKDIPPDRVPDSPFSGSLPRSPTPSLLLGPPVAGSQCMVYKYSFTFWEADDKTATHGVHVDPHLIITD